VERRIERQVANLEAEDTTPALRVFLWMAVEALTKVALRRARAAEGCTDDELVTRWGLAPAGADEDAAKQAKRGLDGEVRRRLIFHGDDECQRVTVRASDGFEHGFEQFDKIRALALQAKECGAAEHVRRALFELLELAPAATATLTSGRYEKPRANWLITKYVRGTFLARRTGSPRPIRSVRYFGGRAVSAPSYGRRTARTNLSFDEKVTPICGDGVLFRLGSFEVWGRRMIR